MGAFANAAKDWAKAIAEENRGGTAIEKSDARTAMQTALTAMGVEPEDDADRLALALIEAFPVVRPSDATDLANKLGAKQAK